LVQSNVWHNQYLSLTLLYLSLWNETYVNSQKNVLTPVLVSNGEEKSQKKSQSSSALSSSSTSFKSKPKVNKKPTVSRVSVFSRLVSFCLSYISRRLNHLWRNLHLKRSPCHGQFLLCPRGHLFHTLSSPMKLFEMVFFVLSRAF
jgi:hypothetical protein